jgi:hypothetical protein
LALQSDHLNDTGQDGFYFCQSNGLDEDPIEPGLRCQGFVFLVFLAGDGYDFRMNEGRNLANAHNEITTIYVRHDQINDHEIRPKCGRNVQCLRPAISHMHLVAELLKQQTQGVSAVSVVVNHENPKTPLCRRHGRLSSRQPTALVMPKSQATILALWASSRLLRDGRQYFLHLLETGGLDQVVIEPRVPRALTV